MTTSVHSLASSHPASKVNVVKCDASVNLLIKTAPPEPVPITIKSNSIRAKTINAITLLRILPIEMIHFQTVCLHSLSTSAASSLYMVCELPIN